MIDAQVKTYRFLMGALGFSIVIHAIALLTMVVLLGPGLDTQAAAIDRARYVADHPWIWRLGWLPWQLTALSDILVSAGLLAYVFTLPGRPGGIASLFGMVSTIAAVIPDQWGEAVFDSSFIVLARDAAGGGDLTDYVKEEARLFLLTGTCGAGGYTLMSVGWMLGAARSAGGVRRHLAFTIAGVFVMALFGVTVWATQYATTHASVEGGYPRFEIVYAFNAAAFPLLLIWMTWMAIVVGDGHHRRCPRGDEELHRVKSPG